MRHLPAVFTPGRRLGPSRGELETLQKACGEQRHAEPVTVRPGRARTAD
ncbi:hypothetical protein [Streptomyces sp.]|nr:hypothetical protein [Streptomyces sp.]